MADITLLQGKTFNRVVRWEGELQVYKKITAISLTDGPPRITAAAHGLPPNWRSAVVRVKGMTQINATNSPPRPADYRPARVIDLDTIEFNAIDATGFGQYTEGGFLLYNEPVSLVGHTARLVVKDKVGGTTLLTLTTENGGVAVNDTDKTISLEISATDTAALSWKAGVYELEMVSGTGVVTSLVSGKVTVVKEIAT